jgi:prepilin-type N-terminal cleavage/methylation domain-containing protein
MLSNYHSSQWVHMTTDSHHVSRTDNGFTLIELSIVLVIIGLIVGGILMGNDLIKQAQLRSVVSSLEKYDTAVQTFTLKYHCVPGDCTTATNFWPQDVGCLYSPDRTTKRQDTCNGDGNGQIGNCTDGLTDPHCVEAFRFWQQLSNAQLVGDVFTGNGVNAPIEAKPGVNVPRVPIRDGGVSMFYIDKSTYAFNPDGTPNILGHYWNVGSENSDGTLSDMLFSGPEAYSIDTKIDDGNGLTGKVIGSYNLAVKPCYDNNGLYHSSDNVQKWFGGVSVGCALYVKATF